jgi:hypothetical protein
VTEVPLDDAVSSTQRRKAVADRLLLDITHQFAIASLSS